MKKYKTIIIRGCKFKVLAKNVEKLEQEEREFLKKEWNTNNLME